MALHSERCPLGRRCVVPVQRQSEAEAHVRVDIRPGIVQVQGKHTGVRTIVPVAATDREASYTRGNRFNWPAPSK